MWDLSSPTKDQTCVPCIGRWILNHWTASEVPSFVLSMCVSGAVGVLSPVLVEGPVSDISWSPPPCGPAIAVLVGGSRSTIHTWRQQMRFFQVSAMEKTKTPKRRGSHAPLRDLGQGQLLLRCLARPPWGPGLGAHLQGPGEPGHANPVSKERRRTRRVLSRQGRTLLPRARVGGGIDWEFGIDVRTAIFKINGKDVPYSPGSSTQYSVMAYMGKESTKEWLCVDV